MMLYKPTVFGVTTTNHTKQMQAAGGAQLLAHPKPIVGTTSKIGRSSHMVVRECVIRGRAIEIRAWGEQASCGTIHAGVGPCVARSYMGDKGAAMVEF